MFIAKYLLSLINLKKKPHKCEANFKMATPLKESHNYYNKNLTLINLNSPHEKKSHTAQYDTNYLHG